MFRSEQAAVSPRACEQMPLWFALFWFLFLLTLAIGRVPCLGVDLLRCVASGEKKESDAHLGVRVKQVSFEFDAVAL